MRNNVIRVAKYLQHKGAEKEHPNFAKLWKPFPLASAEKAKNDGDDEGVSWNFLPLAMGSFILNEFDMFDKKARKKNNPMSQSMTMKAENFKGASSSESTNKST